MKNLLNLGKVLNKNEQQQINGGKGCDEPLHTPCPFAPDCGDGFEWSCCTCVQIW